MVLCGLAWGYNSIVILYGALAFTVFALGIVNTSISTTITRIAHEDNMGGLMGVLDTSEKMAGIVGPPIGGALYAYWTFAPVVVVCGGYVCLAAGVFWGFPQYVLPAINLKESGVAGDKAKAEFNEASKAFTGDFCHC